MKHSKWRRVNRRRKRRAENRKRTRQYAIRQGQIDRQHAADGVRLEGGHLTV